MNHFIEVKEIEISDLDGARVAENYPESGLWIVKTERNSDLIFVNKDQGSCFFICPESIYKSLGLDMPALPTQQEEITDLSSIINIPPGYVSEYFVMDLAKILLNSKK
ncbi:MULTISPECIES: hypothetical protein [unclassified Chryseobacterium]|uniref:hypothetical protein n=1 Tax=unclassified Chryseobacterium TaxID=2593645 RepID=UPI0028533CBF|nr:hypothetical protein [Chryseobacterium sp. CFS7]MDR4892295.1 hypothetical protein [Chryseobacterium sp. CFS7]